ncbi:MAG: hypothetical protein ACKOX4_09935, partial [Bacteroidota bacterium]
SALERPGRSPMKLIRLVGLVLKILADLRTIAAPLANRCTTCYEKQNEKQGDFWKCPFWKCRAACAPNKKSRTEREHGLAQI